MNKHHKITAPERDQIAWWLASGLTIREMARRLSRSPSSISEELKRNKVDGVYGSIKAHQAAAARKRHSHQKYLLRHRPTLRKSRKEYVNHESIYQFLYGQKGVRIDS